MKSLKTLLFILFLGFQLSSAGQWRMVTLPSTSTPLDFSVSKVVNYDTFYVFARDGNGSNYSWISYDTGTTWDALTSNNRRLYSTPERLYEVRSGSL